MQHKDRTDHEQSRAAQLTDLDANAQASREFIEAYNDEDPAAVNDERNYLAQLERRIEALKESR